MYLETLLLNLLEMFLRRLKCLLMRLLLDLVLPLFLALSSTFVLGLTLLVLLTYLD